MKRNFICFLHFVVYFQLEEVQDDGSRGFSNPLADGDNDNTVISQNDNSDA